MALDPPSSAHRNELTALGQMVPNLDETDICSEHTVPEVADFSPDGDDNGEPMVRGRAIPMSNPNCDHCLVLRENCEAALGSLLDVITELTALEKLKPECELLRHQIAQSQIDVDASLISEHKMKSRVDTAEQEAAQAKSRFETLEKEFDAMAKAAEEGKKHAQEANNWRVKYERTVEISEKIQEKRRHDKERFDKLLSLASGYQKEEVLTKLRFKLNTLANAVQSYVPSVVSLLKEIMSSPFFEAEMPERVRAEAARLCSTDVQSAFVIHDTTFSSIDEDEEGLTVELERLLGGDSMTTSLGTPKPKNRCSKLQNPSETRAFEFVDGNISGVSDGEADKILGIGAEAATMVASNQMEFLHPNLSERRATRPPLVQNIPGDIHGKKMLTVREQQKAQMNVSVKEKVALMKKKDAEEVRSPNGSEGGCVGDAVEYQRAGVLPFQDKTAPLEKLSAVAEKVEFSWVRDDLQMSASPSPESSDVEDNNVVANNDGIGKELVTAIPATSVAEQSESSTIQDEHSEAISCRITLTSNQVTTCGAIHQVLAFETVKETHCLPTTGDGPVVSQGRNFTSRTEEFDSVEMLLTSSDSERKMEGRGYRQDDRNSGNLASEKGALNDFIAVCEVSDVSLQNGPIESEEPEMSICGTSAKQQMVRELLDPTKRTCTEPEHVNSSTSQAEMAPVYTTDSHSTMQDSILYNPSRALLSENTKIALDFARRLLVDLQSKVTPPRNYGHTEEVEACVEGGLREGASLEAIVEPTTSFGFREASRKYENNVSPAIGVSESTEESSSKSLSISENQSCAKMDSLQSAKCGTDPHVLPSAPNNSSDLEADRIGLRGRRHDLKEAEITLKTIPRGKKPTAGSEQVSKTPEVPTLEAPATMYTSNNPLLSQKHASKSELVQKDASTEAVSLKPCGLRTHLVCSPTMKATTMGMQTRRRTLAVSNSKAAAESKPGSSTNPTVTANTSFTLSTHCKSTRYISTAESLKVISDVEIPRSRESEPSESISRTNARGASPDQKGNEDEERRKSSHVSNNERTSEFEILPPKRVKTLKFGLDARPGSSFRARNEVQITGKKGELDNGPHTRKRPMTGPRAPKRRKIDGVSFKAKQPVLFSGPTMGDSDDDDRLCVADDCDIGEEEQSPLQVYPVDVHGCDSVFNEKQFGDDRFSTMTPKIPESRRQDSSDRAPFSPGIVAMEKSERKTLAASKKTVGKSTSNKRVSVTPDVAHGLRKDDNEEGDELPSREVDHVHASTCSMDLLSGDMWTIVQRNFRSCDSSNVHNTKEDTFLQISCELAGEQQIWVEYVKKMVAMICTQAASRVHSPRCIRLLMRALREVGSLLTVAEKKEYLRIALTKLFLEDMETSIKATTFALLSPNYELLDWMKDKKRPFSTLLSLAVTTVQVDGKVMLWAWFQQFSEELPLQDVSPESVQRAFEELVAHLDDKAVERSQIEEVVPAPTTAEEDTLTKMAIAYVSPTNEIHANLMLLIERMMNDGRKRIQAALSPHAVEGVAAYYEAYKVSNRLRLCVGAILSTLASSDDPFVVQTLSELLQREILLIRELRAEISSAASRPWIEVYRIVIDSILNLVQVLSHYKI
ncbi:unnamed protein product [Angiostrongylus costaricensis]|uniref:Uncharacterized protein n=1 Tax=Angiostrongylus costaricensis TaxID=334426 RepID=A0A158PE75_ANGCS|nr:unnamed protein product [Angiostrongylus costaricensis]